MSPSQELEVLIKAKYPIVSVVSWEERRVEDAVRQVCQTINRQLHVWSLTQGYKPLITGSITTPGLAKELEALLQAKEAPEFKVFLVKDFHPYLRDARVVRMLRDLAAEFRVRASTLLLLGPTLNLPPDLEKDVTVLDFRLPDAEEIGRKLSQIVDAVKGNPQVKVDTSAEAFETLVHAAQGLTLDEVESVMARSLVERKALDVSVIMEEKKQIIRKSGLLEYIPPASTLEDVGGLALIKDWLQKRKRSFADKAREFGIPAPKGILLLGVQGCGKSLVAKAVASLFGLPMLRLDVGRIFGSLVGQSEENIRKAIAVAESVAPCVLWADELEKGFAGVSGGGVSDSGTTARVFATFLTWMSEKTSPVFLVATANDVSALPPEMLRKGRFDEIFFVDLPEAPEREHILRIHLEKRKREPASYNLPALAELTLGFSGAEIEQVIVGGLYAAFDANRELSEQDLETEAKAMVPLSVMMREEIDELRTWSRLRTRPASKPLA